MWKLKLFWKVSPWKSRSWWYFCSRQVRIPSISPPSHRSKASPKSTLQTPQLFSSRLACASTAVWYLRALEQGRLSPKHACKKGRMEMIFLLHYTHGRFLLHQPHREVGHLPCQTKPHYVKPEMLSLDLKPYLHLLFISVSLHFFTASPKLLGLPGSIQFNFLPKPLNSPICNSPFYVSCSYELSACN